ncbi:MAG: hypothetical protein GTN89_15570 [Acidobacteria bacterium]|nr:hypothetical protein [Acidobacteriota bacterium]NIM62372.1 hypothetical protein [Acidobacteriota bacterium]NIO60681.1 hypothetical protein [Acidobacteriota bacterium]NIQ31747.1 hypothetical protein [Acidobacteriota bacterium]NIQ87052.1 hypothetical protein [Acidobacteriota bacterium]
MLGTTKRTWAVCLGGLLALTGWVLSSHAATIYVDLANESGTEDGTQAFPYNTIREGIDNAMVGDRVFVAAGEYRETILMKDGVSVLGAGAAVCTINATGLSNAAVTFNGTRLSPVLRGFTITGGAGDHRGDAGGFPIMVGGGILIFDADPLITETVITGNNVTDGFALGGGIYVYSTTYSPLIQNNVISNNVALSSDVMDSGEGGGIYVVSKNGGVVITDNLIDSNAARKGAGIYIRNDVSSTAQVTRNTIRNNDAKSGAGIYSYDVYYSTTTVVNNLFVGNGSADAGATGGGLRSTSAGTGAFTIANNTFVQNDLTTGAGGALWLDASASTGLNIAANNIVAGNSATTGGGIDHTNFFGEIRHNAFFNNTGGDLDDGGVGGSLLVGNLFVDPLFVSAAAGNYRLQAGSPLLDQADEPLAPTDDRDSFLRPFDGDVTPGPLSDIGAFEYPGGEISGVMVLADGESLDWQSMPTQDSFNLYRGSLQRLRNTGEYTQDPGVEPMAAMICNILPSELPFNDGFVPAPGETAFYLPTLVISGWEGPLGADSTGLPRPNDHPCP